MIGLNIVGGPSFDIQYQPNMTVRQALETAYNSQGSTRDFTYMLQYYGNDFGYLVDMINGTFDTFTLSNHPYFFWELFVNDTMSQTAIDNTILKDGDIISFQFNQYNPDNLNKQSQTKYNARLSKR